ncbi:MAG TPA: flavin reductase family protein, partial [Thermoanaerobaculia bacterium]|nr:flavin reductase family protein [Thermoanaerobaculia bacterium]
CFASGVTVVTTEAGGVPFGMTVSAFSSVSLVPPLVLVCIEKSARIHEAIPKAERFAVNVLRAGQEALSNKFASRGEDRFEGVRVREGKLKVPILEESLAIVECRLHASLPGGDHTIFVGEVVAAEISEGEPLVYFRSAYNTIA